MFEIDKMNRSFYQDIFGYYPDTTANQDFFAPLAPIIPINPMTSIKQNHFYDQFVIDDIMYNELDDTPIDDFAIESNNEFFGTNQVTSLAESHFAMPICEELFCDEELMDEQFYDQLEDGLVQKTDRQTNSAASKGQIKNCQNMFKCTFLDCTKQFKYKRGLTEHLRVHTGERPFKCSWPNCSKTYARNSSFTRHIKLHTGKLSFSCDWNDCGRKFPFNFQLIAHRRYHTDDRPFVCEWIACEAKFVRKCDLNRHQKRVHMQYL